jgi:hypothetical protein
MAMKKSLTYQTSAQSRLGAKGCQWRDYHISGEPMVSMGEYADLSMELKILHDDILQVQRSPFVDNDSLYTVKDLSGLHFIEAYPADKFYLDFRVIFVMFILLKLEASLIRLWEFYEAKEARYLKVHNVANSESLSHAR